MTFEACSMALQIGEARLRGAGSKKSQLLLILYFALKMLMQRLALLDAIIQANLARMALLTSLGFFKAKTTLLPWETELVPRSPCKEFPVLIFGFPPGSSSEGIEIVVDFVGKTKCGHGVVG